MPDKPYVVFSGDEYVILYKPPLMHSASLKRGESGTLSAWCGERFPGFLAVRGKKAVEGGLLHRLDYGTRGLVFAALTQRVMDTMLGRQEQGLFIKEYEAVVCGTENTPPGFPPCNAGIDPASPPVRAFCVESRFRYYGAGRKSVRPVPLSGENRRHSGAVTSDIYKTEISGMEPVNAVNFNIQKDFLRVRLQLARGFRHQIRCHLAWLGLPILGDTLYGGEASPSPLALNAVKLKFPDPLTGAPVEIGYNRV
jgi:23S rRNA pseudouridine1911/1915/1917 synthase